MNPFEENLALTCQEDRSQNMVLYRQSGLSLPIVNRIQNINLININ